MAVKASHLPVPYRLFINDVGGELFDPENNTQSSNATRFFRDVNAILLMVDPVTTDLSDCDTSEAYSKWLAKHVKDAAVKLRTKDLQDTIDNKILHHGNNHKRIKNYLQ